jgi:hypothetical protein
MCHMKFGEGFLAVGINIVIPWYVIATFRGNLLYQFSLLRILKMEAPCSSKTLLTTYQSTQRHIPGDSFMNFLFILFVCLTTLEVDQRISE